MVQIHYRTPYKHAKSLDIQGFFFLTFYYIIFVDSILGAKWERT